MKQEQFNDLLELFTTQIEYDLTERYSLLSYAQADVQSDLRMRVPLFANTDIGAFSPEGNAFECPHTRANIDYDRNQGIDVSFALRIFVAAAEEAGFVKSNQEIQTLLEQYPNVLTLGRVELENFRDNQELFYTSRLEENNLDKSHPTAKHLERLFAQLNDPCQLMPPSFDEDLMDLLDTDTPPSFDDSSSYDGSFKVSSWLLSDEHDDEGYARNLCWRFALEDAEIEEQLSRDQLLAQQLQEQFEQEVRLEGIRLG